MTKRSSINPPPVTHRVSVYANDDFVALQPQSGCRLKRPEDGSVPVFLDKGANARELGTALVEALGRCRWVQPEDKEFHDMAKHVRNHAFTQDALIRRTGKKTKREAYKTMVWCDVRRSEGVIRIDPFRPDKPGQWNMLPTDEAVVIPATDDPDAVGAALALAIERARTFEG